MEIKKSIYSKMKFTTPAKYRIKISGLLDEHWGSRLGGMSIKETDTEKEITTIEGILKDQSELAGILDTLYDLHYSILSVKCLDSLDNADDAS